VIEATGVRIGWTDLPRWLRAAVESVLGDRVVAARSQSGGFSPGSADRVRTAGGRGAFVKAVSAELNEVSPRMHRAEARVSAALPAHLPVPRLLGSVDERGWVALVLTDVDGRHPRTPWQPDELDRALSTLDQLARDATPAPVPDLPAAEKLYRHDFGGWRRIAADPPPRLHRWAAARLPRLCELADRGLAALAGATLVHGDVRADNLLIGPDGAVTVVDWPFASRGAPWFDRLLLLVNVRLYGGRDTSAELARCAARTGADPADLIAALAGVAGYFLDAGRRPGAPGLPTVRAFQRAQAASTLDWLAELLPD
jgi:aminoglycoside phosphotransferase (APT) family kinase protein